MINTIVHRKNLQNLIFLDTTTHFTIGNVLSNLIRATSLQGINALIEELGGNALRVMKTCNVEVDFTNLEDQYLPYRTYAFLLEYCSHTFNYPCFGLKLANKQNFDILGHIAIAAKSGTNLGEALNWVIKYLHLHSPAVSLTTHSLENDKNLLLSFEINLKPLPQINQVIELTIGLAVAIIKKLSNNQCKPLNVFLPQKIAANTRAYKTHFGCTVIEHRNSAGIVINKNDLALKLNQHEHNKTQAALSFLATRGEHNRSLPAQVSALIRPMLPIYQCSNQTISAALGMHPRTLHRELSKHSTSFVKLKDATRCALAEHYLTQNQYSISTISELLGYQEQATLSANVKRWFGCSPRACRTLWIEICSI